MGYIGPFREEGDQKTPVQEAEMNKEPGNGRVAEEQKQSWGVSSWWGEKS